MKDIAKLIESYLFHWEENIGWEKYKWDALAHFRKWWNPQTPVDERVRMAFAETRNLLSSQYYTPLGMMEKVSAIKPEAFEMLLDGLYDEKQNLYGRVEDYMAGFERLMTDIAYEGKDHWNWREKLEARKLNTYQDPHAVSVYLYLRYPGRHYIYKSTLFDEFARMVGYDIPKLDRIEKYIAFEAFCGKVKVQLLQESGFIGHQYKEWLEMNQLTDPNYNLLTQDFIYSAVNYLDGDHYAKGRVKPKVKTVKTLSKPSSSAAPQAGKTFTGVKGVDYGKIGEQNKRLGTEGELFALYYERQRLKELGIKHEVEHSSIDKGDGCGYDLLSVEDDGATPRYIEVKTTSYGEHQPFYFSDNELQFSRQHKEHYYLYRVYDYESGTKSGSIAVRKGCLDQLESRPVSFCAKL